MTKDVEVDSDTVYDWYTMLHLQLYFQGHTGESSLPGMTFLLHCNCSCSWSVTLTVTVRGNELTDQWHPLVGRGGSGEGLDGGHVP